MKFRAINHSDVFSDIWER